jgi:2-polyprenyl-6-methoxyphenol hydroxylase-like FAD-dependent oxidoreductase
MSYLKAENEVLASGERIVLDIAVVGGGIAGLAAAIALRRTGHKVTVCSSRHGREENQADFSKGL